MDRNSIKQYRLDEQKEAMLWENADFVFDSSALLDLYFSPKSSRDKISEEVFKKLSGRLWLPYQVQYEYLKNRESTIKKPINEKYEPLKNEIRKISSTTFNDVFKRIDEIIKRTVKDDKHPHIRQGVLEDFKTKVEGFQKQNEKFEK